MTGEEFRTRYQLGERLTGPPVVTVQAIGPSGLPVLVHYLVGNERTDSATILTRARNLQGPAQEKILEIDEVDGVPVVVSQPLPDFGTFMDWVGDGPGQDGSVPVGESGPPGTYTQFFKTPPKAADPGPSASDGPQKGAGAAPSSEEGGRPPGAYTMLFGHPTSGAPDAQAPPPAEEVAAGEKPPPEPFPEPPTPHEQAGKKPGAYTMLFGGGAPAVQKGPETSGSAPSVPPSEPAREETDTSAGKAPAGQETPSGSYTQLFGGSTVESGEAEESGQGPAPASPPFNGRIEPREGPSGADLLSQGQGGPEETAPPNVVFPTIPATPSPPLSKGVESGSQPTTKDGTPTLPQHPARDESGPGQPAPPPPTAQTEAPRPPGAYTRIFGGQRTAEPSRKEPPEAPEVKDWRPPSAAQPPQGEVQDSSGPSWQRWKESAGASGRHIPSDDYLQRLREPSEGTLHPGGRQEAPGRDLASRPPVAEPVFPGGDAQQQGPGHYTMVRKGLVPSPPPGSPRPPSSPGQTPKVSEGRPASAPSRKSRTLTIVGLVVVLLAAAAIVIVFALTA